MVLISYNSPISAKQNGKSYDTDSSPLAWEHYKRVYTSKHWPLITEFDLTNIATYDDLYGNGFKNKDIRLLAGIKQTSPYSIKGKLWSKFTLGGDCDFNFNYFKVDKFKKILGESNKDLEYCSRKHHTLLNFSIMAATGRMNNFKNSIDPLDRLDTFVYHLNQYFTMNSQLIFSESGLNKEPLRNFLDSFDDVYDYCKKIYFINDKKFVERIIYEGKMPLKKPEDVKRYMKLAKDFWSEKQKVWNEMELNEGYQNTND